MGRISVALLASITVFLLSCQGEAPNAGVPGEEPGDAKIASATSEANQFPILGATYQLDRARFPEKIAICTTEEAMDKYLDAEQAGDQATMKKMLVDTSTMEDIAELKNAGGCTLISSFSQATVIKKGVRSHQAEFAAFPFEPMWGFYLYFGGQVK